MNGTKHHPRSTRLKFERGVRLTDFPFQLRKQRRQSQRRIRHLAPSTIQSVPCLAGLWAKHCAGVCHAQVNAVNWRRSEALRATDIEKGRLKESQTTIRPSTRMLRRTILHILLVPQEWPPVFTRQLQIVSQGADCCRLTARPGSRRCQATRGNNCRSDQSQKKKSGPDQCCRRGRPEHYKNKCSSNRGRGALFVLATVDVYAGRWTVWRTSRTIGRCHHSE